MHIAVVGATGAVGQEICSILEERQFPAHRITLLASGKSAGKEVRTKGRGQIVQRLRPDSFGGVDLALFAVGADVAREFQPYAQQAGTLVIDNSSAFRMVPEVPLVIPEINAQDLKDRPSLIANPNCSTIIMAVAVWPLHQVQRVSRLVVSTYQAASGAGAPAMRELLSQSNEFLNQVEAQPNSSGAYPAEITPSVLPQPCAFNVFSHDSAIDEDGYNVEEVKMGLETHKIFHDPAIRITATCVRVPVLRAHSESINLTFEKPITPEDARDALSQAPGLRVVDDRESNYFPMPKDASGKDEVLVGRIRPDLSDPTGCSLNLFVCGDQLRKGAALNAIQIAECLQ